MWDVLSEIPASVIKWLAGQERVQIQREEIESLGPTQSLKEILLAVPNAGEDRDFERPEDHGRAIEH